MNTAPKITTFSELRIGQIVYDPQSKDFCVVSELYPLFHYCPLRREHELKIIHARGISDRISFSEFQRYIPYYKILDESEWQDHIQAFQTLKTQL